MVWGMSFGTFTVVHVVISLAGIGSGFVVMAGFLTGKERHAWTALFLATTVATSVTGFGFPFDHLLPSHVVGVVSLVVLAVAIFARYSGDLEGARRWIYVVSSAAALYLNVFVGVVQAFHKVSALHALAPQQTEPPFLIVQIVVLALFVVLTVGAARRFRGESMPGLIAPKAAGPARLS
jgi:hypothetical protein